MAVHGCVSLNLLEADGDGDITFKRNNTTSMQSQSSLDSPLSSLNNQSGKTLPRHLSPKGENTYSRRSKVCPAAKVVVERPSFISTQSLNPTPEVSTSTKDVSEKLHGDAEYSEDSDDAKPLSFKLSSCSAAKQGNSISSKKPKIKADSSDSDDDKPLSCNVFAAHHGFKNSNSVPINEVSDSRKPVSTPSVKPSTPKGANVSGCEEASSSKLLTKTGLVKPMKQEYESEDEKPLSSKFLQNGAIKRKLDSASKSGNGCKPNNNNSVQSSNKKAKHSESPTTLKLKNNGIEKKELNTSSDDDDDFVPISRKRKNTSSTNNQLSSKKVVKKFISSSSKKESKSKIGKNQKFKSSKVSPESGEGQKWTTLEHNGVIFPPPYKPHGVKMLYNGKPVDLTPEQEEVATMFAVMKDTDYASKKTFIDNFMNDWRVLLGKNHVIKKLELCDFTPIYEWHLKEKERKKQMTSEEKKEAKEEKLKQEEKYMWAIVDGVKEKVGNFRVEPPGLFRGRGEHPKMGKLKKRIHPCDITINIGKDAPVPECPIPGQRWKEVKHDNTVTWLAFWNDPINSKEFKYVFLAASSSLKGQSDKEKYEKARKLKDFIHNIRANYTRDFTKKDEMKRQIAVATYLIDKLALRAGNEKDDDEADTVGCCTLKVENVTLIPPNKLQFDFLGKDSIRYFNTVEVELPVYKAIGEFRKGGKSGGDDLFDKLDTNKLNAHLKELMPGLTAKVFRTYNASITLDQMLNKETKCGTVQEKIAVYQSANKEVAIICNHQRSVSKTHDAQMLRLDDKIVELKELQEELKEDLSRAKKGKPLLKDKEGKTKRNSSVEALEKKLSQVDAKIEKIELDKRIKEDLKTVALGTSKINYLDPRISVAWCKRNEVPIEKIFNKSLLAKFSWAMDAEPGFRF